MSTSVGPTSVTRGSVGVPGRSRASTMAAPVVMTSRVVTVAKCLRVRMAFSLPRRNSKLRQIRSTGRSDAAAAMIPSVGEPSSDVEGPSKQVRILADELLPLFYEELRRIGRRERRRVGAGETMQTTALVNEAYLKLRKMKGWVDDRHFLCAA